MRNINQTSQEVDKKTCFFELSRLFSGQLWESVLLLAGFQV